MTVEWLVESETKPNVAVINSGSKVKFVGIIRGQGDPQITYYANTVEEITDGMILSDWIYRIEEDIQS